MSETNKAEELAIEAIKDRMAHCFIDGKLIQKPQVLKDYISHFTEGYNSRQNEIDELKAEIERLKVALSDIQQHQLNFVELSTTTVVYKIAEEALTNKTNNK